jgi:hypothetical protein
MEPLEDKEKEEGLHYDRTYEWDSTNDNLGRFIESELLPVVEKQVTPNGNPIRISSDSQRSCHCGPELRRYRRFYRCMAASRPIYPAY